MSDYSNILLNLFIVVYINLFMNIFNRFVNVFNLFVNIFNWSVKIFKGLMLNTSLRNVLACGA